ncbi:alpha/beta hydrolase [Nocardioides sp. AE5]|uniref:alpha/beta hydrolase n=1 Tax=Nocardioides sp. AE5 TaxID=2962573 RepID=UPI0028811DEB|nr:alpha/beta hydrolase [Nocardioides sp. AE5]MDT0202560.1 alpha/beta hydrolase [Nocardioides sp. AE5]
MASTVIASTLRAALAAQVAVKRTVLTTVLGLPDAVKRGIAGKPVVRDGLTLDLETQLILRLQQLTRETPAESVPIEQGREILAVQSSLVGGSQPIALTADGQVGGVPTRTYVPRRLLASDARPTLVFFHGGGFIYGGGHTTHDAVCRFLAEQAGVQVISVDYRLAPEHPFPAAYDDCLAAFRAVAADPVLVKADPGRIAVGGDSAGGNLAAVVALAAAQEGLPLAFQLLIYPCTDFAVKSASRRELSQGFFLTDEFMDLAEESYLAGADVRDLRLSPIYAAVPDGLAPAHVVTAGFDPLRDEGEAYAKKLRDKGVQVTHVREEGMIHGFLNMVGVGNSGPRAVGDIADQLAAGLS